MRADATFTVLSFPPLRSTRHNPFLGLLRDALLELGVRTSDFTPSAALRQRFDVVHVHWPERILEGSPTVKVVRRALLFLVLMWWQRRRGAVMVWTVHNLAPHEEARPARWFWRRFLGLLDGVVSLTSAGLPHIRERFPALDRTPIEIVRHGHYRDAYPSPPDRATARHRLGLPGDGTVLAFVGLIRPYKNVLGLLEAFRTINDRNAVLLLAGQPLDDRLGDEVRCAAGRDRRVRLQLGFLDPAEVATLVAAADLVVLPFTEVFNSGSALLALSLDRPVLVPATPTMQELAEQVGDGWVQRYEGRLDGERVESALEAVQARPRPQRPLLDPVAWSEVAAQTYAFYRRLRRSP